jgi:hypothetical protein
MDAESVLGGGTAEPPQQLEPPTGLLTTAAKADHASHLEILIAPL